MVTSNAEEIEQLQLRSSEIEQQIDIAEQMGMPEQVDPLTQELESIEDEIAELEAEDEEEEEDEEIEEEAMLEEEAMAMEEEGYEEEGYEEEEESAAEIQDQAEAMEAFNVLQQMAEDKAKRHPMDMSQYDTSGTWDEVEEIIEEDYADEIRAADQTGIEKGMIAQGKKMNNQTIAKIKAAWKPK